MSQVEELLRIDFAWGKIVRVGTPQCKMGRKSRGELTMLIRSFRARTSGN